MKTQTPMKTDVITKEAAQAEVNAWLDFKKVDDKNRESNADSIDTIANAICKGVLVLDENKVFIHTLKFAIEGEKTSIEKLEYKPRLKVSATHMHLSNVKSTDVDGRLCAYVAALTSKNKEIIKALDTEDYKLSQAIAIFFL